MKCGSGQNFSVLFMEHKAPFEMPVNNKRKLYRPRRQSSSNSPKMRQFNDYERQKRPLLPEIQIGTLP